MAVNEIQNEENLFCGSFTIEKYREKLSFLKLYYKIRSVIKQRDDPANAGSSLKKYRELIMLYRTVSIHSPALPFS